MKKSFLEKEGFAKSDPKYYNYKQVQLVVDVRLIYKGTITGNNYIWDKAGAILSVDERDVPDLLVQHAGTGSCCGGGISGKLVQLV